MAIEKLVGTSFFVYSVVSVSTAKPKLSKITRQAPNNEIQNFQARFLKNEFAL